MTVLPTDKAKMYELLHERALGNTLLSWPTVAAYLNSGFRGYVGLRTKKAGGKHAYWCTRAMVREIVALWVGREGVPGCDIVVQQMAPHRHGTIQGELRHDMIHGYDLHYSLEQVPIRECRDWRDASGLSALCLLRGRLWPASFDEIMDLLDAYPDAVVEFSAFGVAVGWASGRNHVIWEVRQGY